MSLNMQEIQRVSERADDLRYAGDRADSHVNSHIVSPPPLARLSPSNVFSVPQAVPCSRRRRRDRGRLRTTPSVQFVLRGLFSRLFPFGDF
jgi:hypothetical protein